MVDVEALSRGQAMEDQQQNKGGTSYGNIFKTTFLFGFVQVFKAVIAIVKNKLVAILIGPEGMGLLGIFSSTIQMIQTGAGLGVNQSAVRDVAEAKGTGNHERMSRIIKVTNRVVIFTGLLGCLVTLILSHYLSIWTLGDTTYTVSYCILALVVALNIINEGKQALLKGARYLRALAYASMIGSVVGLVTAIPLYYFFGKDGIVPELLIASILALLVSQYYVNRVPVDKEALSFKETVDKAKPMVTMGVALMFVTLLGTITTFAINAFVRSRGGLSDVGFFNAGSGILHAYFGVIITALMTDYYPRIAAVNQDNAKVQDELNKQTMVSVVLCCPLIVLFIALMPIFIKILYTAEFLPTLDYLRFGIFWTVITICSNQVDMILIAKANTKVFMIIAIVVRVIQLLLCMLLYNLWGLMGLGISYAFLGVLHMVIMTLTVHKLYGIHFSSEFVKTGVVVLLFTIIATIINTLLINETAKYVAAISLVFLSTYYSYRVSRMKLNIDFVDIIRNKIKK